MLTTATTTIVLERRYGPEVAVLPRAPEVVEVEPVEAAVAGQSLRVLERGEHDPDDRQQGDEREQPEDRRGHRLLAAVRHRAVPRSAMRLISSASAKITASRQIPTAAADPTRGNSKTRWYTWNAGTVVAVPGPPAVVM